MMAQQKQPVATSLRRVKQGQPHGSHSIRWRIKKEEGTLQPLTSPLHAWYIGCNGLPNESVLIYPLMRLGHAAQNQ